MPGQRCGTCQFFYQMKRGSTPHWSDPYGEAGSCTYFNRKTNAPYWAFSGYRVTDSSGSHCKTYQKKDETADCLGPSPGIEP
jgi:hypothetical protein